MISVFQKKCKSKDIDLDYFELIEYFDEIKNHLDYIKNLPQYLKTSTNFVDVFEQPVSEYLIKDGDTLESIARIFFGDPEKYDIIMDYNNLDYYDVNSDTWIGRRIKIPTDRIITKDIPGIIDGLVGLNVLGKDINSTFAFTQEQDINGNFDIKTLEYEECFMQAISDLISKISKGTVPEFPSLGNNTLEIIGENLGALSYSMIINDLITTLRQEPTLNTVQITDVKLQDDAILIDFSFKSVLETSYVASYNSKTGNVLVLYSFGYGVQSYAGLNKVLS